MPATVDAPTPAPLDSIDVTFAVVEAPPTRSAPPPTPERSRPKARGSNDAVPKSQPRAPRRTPATRAAQSDPPTSVSNHDTTLDLDPEKAAGMFLLETEPQSAEAQAVAPEETESAGAPDYFPGVGTKHYLTTRDPPRLRRDRDGTYRYRGLAFRATIGSDGSVSFDDRYQQGLTQLTFDLTDAVLRRRGEDPYRAEKEWFLAGTEDLRRELLEQWRQKHHEAALRKLVGRLKRISEDDTLSEDQKAARILALYRDTNDDAVGVAAREAIASFVAEELPELPLPPRDDSHASP